jgi:hypothetical protein
MLWEVVYMSFMVNLGEDDEAKLEALMEYQVRNRVDTFRYLIRKEYREVFGSDEVEIKD